MEIHRYRYRKVTPEMLNTMKELRKAGFSYTQIAEKVGIGKSGPPYYLDPIQRKKKLRYINEYWHKLSDKERKRRVAKVNRKRRKKQTEYIVERYRNDKEFHDRFLNNTKRSQHKIRKQRLKDGKCTECGGKKDKKHLSCHKCRLKYSNWDKARRRINVPKMPR